MIDCFALLNEPRRPWIEPDALKRKFLALSAEVHPDRVHSASEAEREGAAERYPELNVAYNRLRDPKERLRHLLELELGAKPEDLQNIPPDLMDLFLEVGRRCREADAFLAEGAGVTSPLLKAQRFARSQESADKLTALQREINSRREGLLVELKRLDAAWEESAKPGSPERRALLAQLEELYRLLSYFARWSDQMQERIVQLSF